MPCHDHDTILLAMVINGVAFFLAGRVLKPCWKLKPLNVSPESAEQKFYWQQVKVMLYNVVLMCCF